MECSKCGFDNKPDAQFCKKCGSSLKDKENLISRINSKINILAVFLGMIVSVLVLFVGAVLFSGLSQTLSIFIYLELVLLAMAFFGSIITGLGSKNEYEGSINGGFLTLVILVLIGLVVGIIFMAAVGLFSALSSAFGSGASSGALSSLNSSTSTSGSNGLDGLIFLIEFIVGIILIFIAGIIGGAFGYFLKDSFKKISE